MIQEHNSGMGDVDLIDQKMAGYKFNRKSLSGRFFLVFLFRFMDMTLGISYIDYMMLYPEAVDSLDY